MLVITQYCRLHLGQLCCNVRHLIKTTQRLRYTHTSPLAAAPAVTRFTGIAGAKIKQVTLNIVHFIGLPILSMPSRMYLSGDFAAHSSGIANHNYRNRHT